MSSCLTLLSWLSGPVVLTPSPVSVCTASVAPAQSHSASPLSHVRGFPALRVPYGRVRLPSSLQPPSEGFLSVGLLGPVSSRDNDGSPRFLTLPFRTCRALRPRRSLRQSLPVATAYYCLPEFRPCRPADHNLTRLNRFTARYSPSVALPTLNLCRYLLPP